METGPLLRTNRLVPLSVTHTKQQYASYQYIL